MAVEPLVGADPAAAAAPPGSLAQLWEVDQELRYYARENQCLTEWPDQNVIGVASCRSMSLNVRCLQPLAQWWASQVSEPQAVPVQLLRDEARYAQISLHQSTLFIFIVPFGSNCLNTFVGLSGRRINEIYQWDYSLSCPLGGTVAHFDGVATQCSTCGNRCMGLEAHAELCHQKVAVRSQSSA